MDSRPMVHIRLPKTLVRRVDHLAVDRDLDRARAIEQLIEIALGSLETQEPQRELRTVGSQG